MERNSARLLGVSLSGMIHVFNFVTTWLIPPHPVVRRPFPLIDAVKRGDVTQVRILIEQGADPNARETQVIMRQGFWRAVIDVPEGNAKPSLILAVSAGNHEIVRLLLDSGADINASYGFGVTALECAASNANEETAKLLIERGANVNVCGFDTPLNAAAVAQNRRMIRSLLENGADVNGRDDEGFTALMEPAGAGYVNVVEDLVSAGIDINAKNNEGRTALDYAKQYRRSAVEALLLQAGARA